MTDNNTNARGGWPRVEIPAYSDMWMRGAQYGVVERTVPSIISGKSIFLVRLDKAPNRLRGYAADDCRFV